MKPLNNHIGFLLILVLVGCSDQGSDPILHYTLTVEDHETTAYQFPPGAYYSYDFPEPPTYEFDVDAVFSEVAGFGVQIQDAWYKPYGNACTPPGSNISMPATVPAALVIRVDRPNAFLRTIRFDETSSPDLDWCAYRVRHYHFIE